MPNFMVNAFRRITGAANSHKQMNAVKDDMERVRQNMAYANSQASTQQKRLQQMLDELSGLDRQHKALQKDYKNKVRRLEYDEQNLRGLGQHYTKTIGEVEAKGNELLARKGQLEARSAKLEERAAPLDQKLRDIAQESKTLAQTLEGTEIQALAEQFQQRYREVEANKEKLKGLSKETSPELFTQHHQMVRALGALHKQTEETIKSKHAGLSDTHKKIALELSRVQKDYQDLESEGRDIQRGQEKLERKKQYVNTYQGMLDPELKKFAEAQDAFKADTEGLKTFQEQLSDLGKSYTSKKSEAEGVQKELAKTSTYQDQMVSQLRGLQSTLDFIGDRYQHQAGNAKLLGGIGTAVLALATLGTGTLGTLAAGAGSLATMNTMQKDIDQNMKRWGAYQDVDSQILGGSTSPDWNRRAWDKTPLNRIDFKSRVFDTKIKMPEFGGLAQSIKHFEMPTLPTLAELPQLSAALGNIRSSEDIANLGVLPGSTAKSPNRSLLNPQLIKTLSSLMKSIDMSPMSGRASNNNKKKRGAFSLPRLGGLGYGC